MKFITTFCLLPILCQAAMDLIVASPALIKSEREVGTPKAINKVIQKFTSKGSKGCVGSLKLHKRGLFSCLDIFKHNSAPKPIERGRNFKVLERLGEGRSGIVFKALDTTSGEEIALKSFKKIPAGHNEAEILRKLGRDRGSPFITQSGGYYIPQELIEGEQLFQELIKPENRNDINLMNRMQRNAAKELRKLHSLGVIHGDPHSSNFLIDKNGQVRVVDFGRSYLSTNGDDQVSDLTMLFADIRRFY